MTQTILFEDLARDVAFEQVLDHAGEGWQVRASILVQRMPADEVTGEDVRIACEAANVKPHHHNAWGAFIAGLVRDGSLIPTGRYVAMQAKGSHARKTQVYRRINA